VTGQKSIAALGFAVVGFGLLALPWDVLDPGEFRRDMAAVKAMTSIPTAQMQYHSRYGTDATTLTQLGPSGAELIDRDLAGGEKGGFKFVLQQTPTGYALIVTPTAFGISGSHTYLSDQSMTIHQHNGQEPATANDPLLGETTQQQQQQTSQTT